MRKYLLPILGALLFAAPAQAIDLRQLDEGGAVWVPGFRELRGDPQVEFGVGPSMIVIPVTDISNAATWIGLAPRAGRIVSAYIANNNAGTGDSSDFEILIGNPDVISTGVYKQITKTGDGAYLMSAVTVVAGAVSGITFPQARTKGLSVEVSAFHPVAVHSDGSSVGQADGVIYILIQ